MHIKFNRKMKIEISKNVKKYQKNLYIDNKVI